jgi:hypothetical protein
MPRLTPDARVPLFEDEWRRDRLLGQRPPPRPQALGGLPRLAPRPTRPRPAPAAPVPNSLRAMLEPMLEGMRLAVRGKQYSPRTEKAYLFWASRFVAFSGWRPPESMGSAEVKAFLAHLAANAHISASTQNQAFSALLFLYREVLGRSLEGLEDTPRAKRPVRLRAP